MGSADRHAIARKPHSSISTIPNTRWCTCKPPPVSMLPGHQGTFGLRINLVLIRIRTNESRNAPSKMNPARSDRRDRSCVLGCQREGRNHAYTHACFRCAIVAVLPAFA